MSWRDLAAHGRRARRLRSEPLIAERPERPALNTALTSERGILLPRLESALDRFFRDSEVGLVDGAP